MNGLGILGTLASHNLSGNTLGLHAGSLAFVEASPKNRKA